MNFNEDNMPQGITPADLSQILKEQNDKVIRDRFAAHAMSGVITMFSTQHALDSETYPQMVARKSYELADAMIEASNNSEA